jgi:hypothetical protein
LIFKHPTTVFNRKEAEMRKISALSKEVKIQEIIAKAIAISLACAGLLICSANQAWSKEQENTIASKIFLENFRAMASCPAAYFAVAVKHQIYNPEQRGIFFTGDCRLLIKGLTLAYERSEGETYFYSLEYATDQKAIIKVDFDAGLISFKIFASEANERLLNKLVKVAFEKWLSHSDAYIRIAQDLSKVAEAELEAGAASGSAFLDEYSIQMLNEVMLNSGKSFSKRSRDQMVQANGNDNLISSSKFSLLFEEASKVALSVLLLALTLRRFRT